MYQPEAVKYRVRPHTFEADDKPATITVERLSRARITEEVGQRVLQTMLLAYVHQFATVHQLADAGDIIRHFAPRNKDRVEVQVDRMNHDLKKGSQYWIIDGPGSSYVSMAKVSPSRPKERWTKALHVEAPNAFVNDVVTVPPKQGLGYGTMVLDAALRYGGRFDSEGPVSLHAYRGNEGVNRWFTSIGFNETDALVQPMAFGNSPIEQVFMTTASADHAHNTTLADMQRKLWGELSHGGVMSEHAE